MSSSSLWTNLHTIISVTFVILKITKIYYYEHLHTLQNMLRKWRITHRVFVLVAFKCIVLSGRRLLGKCLTGKQNKETLKTVCSGNEERCNGYQALLNESCSCNHAKHATPNGGSTSWVVAMVCAMFHPLLTYLRTYMYVSDSACISWIA